MAPTPDTPPTKRKRRPPRYPPLPVTPAPSGPTAESYRIAGYTDGIVGASPECDVLRPKYDSGLKWGSGTPQPGDWRWGKGVAGGNTWDGTFHRDLARFPGSGDLFWSAYLKPGTVAGMQGGYWLNFGSGWSHLHNDAPAQLLTGASQKLFWQPSSGHIPVSGPGDTNVPATPGLWHLVIEATKFVTLEVVNVWTGTKAGGNDPVGTYARTSGLDPVATLTVEAA